MRGFYAALISGAVGVGCLAAIATIETPRDLTGCEIVREYEDQSVLLDCSGESHGEPMADPKLDFWEQLDLIRSTTGEEYA